MRFEKNKRISKTYPNKTKKELNFVIQFLGSQNANENSQKD